MKPINETHYSLTIKCIYIFIKNIKSTCHSCGKTQVGSNVCWSLLLHSKE